MPNPLSNRLLSQGDLATKKIFPSLCNLFEKKILPPSTQIIGYARSDMSVDRLSAKSNPFMKVSSGIVSTESIPNFGEFIVSLLQRLLYAGSENIR